jgi:hypothetical protein
MARGIAASEEAQLQDRRARLAALLAEDDEV